MPTTPTADEHREPTTPERAERSPLVEQWRSLRREIDLQEGRDYAVTELRDFEYANFSALIDELESAYRALDRIHALVGHESVNPEDLESALNP